MNEPTFRLLIADDEYWVRERLRDLLDWQQLMISLIEPAVDGEDAVGKIRTEHPDILITDINMPFVSGNDVIRFAKEQNPSTAVIVLSGYSDFVFVRDALVCGAIDYVLKPISRNALLDVVEKAIAALRTGRAHERELAELNEKLLRASSILRDRELSTLIGEEQADRASEDMISELELSFAGFSLVLVKLTRLPATSRNLSLRAPRRAQEIKSLISKMAPGSVVFHNVYARNEFILLTGIRGDELMRVCQELPDRLERCTGFRSSVAVSRFYYSFNDLQSAYHEAHSALTLRRVSSVSAVVRVEEARKLQVRRRITPEQENQLLFGLQSRNKKLVREVIFRHIGMERCEQDEWLLAEVKQTAEYLAAIILHYADADATSLPAMENFAYLLDAALESQDVRETCSLLDQVLDEALDDSGAGGTSESMKRTIRRVQSYIDERYFRNLSLTSLSKLFRVERSYLSKAFKQVTGSNLMLAITKRRIEKAQEYIRGDDPNGRNLSLADISSLVGYEEYAYFNRVFRKITGMSPSQYKVAVLQGETK